MQNNTYQTILDRALEAVHQTAGITGRVLKREITIGRNHRVDAQVAIEANGQRYEYLVEIKRIDRYATLANVKHQLGHYGDQLLLVAPRITADVADKCRELDLQFIDAAGNAYLRRPGFLVFVAGRKAVNDDMQQTMQEPKRAGTANQLRIVFALLCQPQLINAPYRDINLTAGVALGAVGWVLVDLKTRGYLAEGKKGKKLLEHQRLVQEWVTNYPIKLRPKLHPRRFRAPTPGWWKQLDITQYGAQWGGEVAAAKLTGYLRPQNITLYLHAENERTHLTKLVVDHKLQADPKGNIEILDAFWNFRIENLPPETVPPLLAYADLIATLDPRNIETAKLIHDQYLTTTKAQA